MTPLTPASTSGVSEFTAFQATDLNLSLTEQLSYAMRRLSGESLARAKVLLGRADEILVQNDAGGRLCAVLGFRFADVSEGLNGCRLIYVLFATAEGSGLDRENRIRRAALELSRRQTERYPQIPLVWMNGPGCEPVIPVPAGRVARSLTMRPTSQVPATVRFQTDEPAGGRLGEVVPPQLETVALALLRDHREMEKSAVQRLSLGKLTFRQQFGAGVAAAAVLVAVIGIQGRQDASKDTAAIAPALRTKGAASLHVYRQKDPGSEELISGATVKGGDRIRFGVDLPDQRRIRVVGVESSGELYVAWPLPGQPATDVLPPGTGQLLSGAATFDDSPGRESLYLVSCPADGAAPVCTSRGALQEPTCPAGCTLTPFALEKGGAR